MSTITLAVTSTSVTATGGPLPVTASVTNSAAVPARVVLGVFAAAGAPESAPGHRAWAQVDRPLREIAPGTTEQYTVTLTPPPGTAAGDYLVRLIAYDADRPPEEYSDQAQQLTVVVPAGPAPAKKGVPWWIYAVAAALVLVIGVVAFLVLRPKPAPPPPPAPPSSPVVTTPPPNPCMAPFVPRLTRPGDLTCVTTLSAAEAKADNDPELQRLRKDPTGPYGPDTCVQGYVWRVAYPDDLICVTGATRDRTYWENQGHPEGTP
jgi:hypothetical protein